MNSNKEFSQESQQNIDNLNNKNYNRDDQQKNKDSLFRKIIPNGYYLKSQKNNKQSNQQKLKSFQKVQTKLQTDLRETQSSINVQKVKTTKQLVSEMLSENLNSQSSQLEQQISNFQDLKKLQNTRRQTSQNASRLQAQQINSSRFDQEAQQKSAIKMNKQLNYEMNSISSSIYRSFSNGANQSFIKQPENQKNQVLKFEIHIDSQYGQQQLVVYDKNNIGENVDRFALKFGIRSKSKVNKLKKYIKKQFEYQNDITTIS